MFDGKKLLFNLAVMVMFISDCRPAPTTHVIIVSNSNLSVQHLHLTGPDSRHSPIAKW